MLLSLVNDILDFSRVEENALELVRDKFELRDILAPTPHYRAMAEQTGTTITVAPVPACPPLIGDRRRLEQVLGNLLNNAVKFTHQGRITVELTITNQSPSEVLVQLDVADTGPGVPEESRTRIFEPFRQADEGVNRAHGGSGLGLAIVNRLCRLMGGTVELVGSGEPGARFRVTLPFPLAASRPPGDEPETETKPKPIPDLHCRVLVVEDNPDAMDIITELLTVRGCSVHQAADGPEGVRAAEDTDFDLIFMDCHLPVLNGYEATRRIRRTLQDQGRPQPPIVALTADAFSGDREKCLQAGMQDHLSKPFTPDQLISMLEQHLSQPQCET
jgi:CheY-like chemotaxis protein